LSYDDLEAAAPQDQKTLDSDRHPPGFRGLAICADCATHLPHTVVRIVCGMTRRLRRSTAVSLALIAVVLAVIRIWTAPWPPSPERAKANRVACTGRLNGLWLAIERHVAEQGGLAANLDELKARGYVKNVPGAFYCPSVTAGTQDAPTYRYLGPHVTPGIDSPLVICDQCGAQTRTRLTLRANGSVAEIAAGK
jgi:hypothetical protein